MTGRKAVLIPQLDRPIFRVSLALLAGAVSPLAFAPFGIWPLQILSLLVFLALLRTSQRPLLESWSYGLGFFGAGTSWIYHSIYYYGNAPVWLAAAMTGIFCLGVAFFFCLPGWLLSRFRRSSVVATVLIFPAVWVLGEWFRTHFLTGFPWLLSGYATLDTWLEGWAPLIGIYGQSFLLALIAALALTAFCLPERRKPVIALLLVLTAGSFWLDQKQWSRDSGERLSVLLVQGNIDQNQKWRPQERARILRTHQTPALQAEAQQLVVWPETAVPMLADQAEPFLSPLAETLRRRGSALLTGVPMSIRQPDGSLRYHNAILAMGEGHGRYLKQRLVPFGEYVPLEAWLRGLIDFFDLPMSSFSPGPENQPPLRALGYAIGASICYEIVYPELVREGALLSDLLLTVSNDAWFGDSLAPHQHLQMARMRALENGRALIRATNNGITAVMDARGKIVARLPQFEQATLRAQVPLYSGTTPFTRVGSWPVLGLSLLILVSATLVRLRQAQRRSK